MTILEIYKKYKIMPAIGDHQLRVAAVAEQICESLDIKVDIASIILACLLHDMGKIVALKLDYFPEFLEPEGLDFWQNIQNEHIQKYGKDEHHATIEIVKELRYSNNVTDLIDAVDYLRSEETKNSNNLDKKICYYVDMRVNPFGTVSLEDRILDARKRYGPNSTEFEKNAREIADENLREIEKQIFSHSSIKPEDINDNSIANRVEKLRNTNIL